MFARRGGKLIYEKSGKIHFGMRLYVGGNWEIHNSFKINSLL
jgi:hypothetical protein